MPVWYPITAKLYRMLTIAIALHRSFPKCRFSGLPGMTYVDHGLVPKAGHFTQEEAPEDTWRLIADFSGV